MMWWHQLSHNVKNTYAVTFFLESAQSILFQQLISGYVFVLTNSNKAVGIIEGIKGISQLLFSFPAGYFADKIRRDVILRISGVLGLVSSVLTLCAIEHASIQLLNVAFGLWGLFVAFQDSAMEALFADSIPHGRRSLPFTIKYNISNAAMIMGPLTGVLLLYFYGDVWRIHELTIVLEFGTILMAIASLLLLRFDDDLAETGPGLSDEVAGAVPTAMTPLRTPSAVNDGVDSVYVYDDAELRGEDDASSKRPHEGSALLPVTLADGAATVNKAPGVTTFWIFNSTHIPWLIFGSDFIISNGAGMTVNFFPLFFKEEYGLSPIQVSVLFLTLPLLTIGLSVFSQRSSKALGRMPVVILTRTLSLLCLFSMTVAGPLELQIVLFLLRGGMMRCSQPLRRSILMDHVPKEIRARWNALEGLSVFSWSGSAVLGGFLIDTYGYRMCFLITSFVYTAGLALELFLLPLTKHAVEK